VNWREDQNGISSRQQHEIGLAAIKRIKQSAPEVAILAMTAHAELVEQARQHGADVSVLKEKLNDFDQLEQLLRKAVETVRFPQAQQLQYEPLTDREQRVLALIAQGLTDQEIADRLAWGIGVIKREAQSIFIKLGARNRAHAVARGYDLGLIAKGGSFLPEEK
ncbi:response regulator transcription factor, partial [Chloroflexus sp.]